MPGVMPPQAIAEQSLLRGSAFQTPLLFSLFSLFSRQQPPGDVAIVLLVPEFAQTTVWVLELWEQVEESAVAGGLRPMLSGPPEAVQPMACDGPQPGPERSRPAIVAEVR